MATSTPRTAGKTSVQVEVPLDPTRFDAAVDDVVLLVRSLGARVKRFRDADQRLMLTLEIPAQA